jgi:hypothetical protein
LRYIVQLNMTFVTTRASAKLDPCSTRHNCKEKNYWHILFVKNCDITPIENIINLIKLKTLGEIDG